MFQKENPFEIPLPKFRVDTLGYGPRSFIGCTLLHKMIGEGHFLGISRYMADLLTDAALNGGSCQYDGWKMASPLWLVTNLNMKDPRLRKPMLDLVSILVKKGADVNHLATNTAFADREDYRTSSPLCEAARNGFSDVVSVLIMNGANATFGDEMPLVEAAKEMHEVVVKILLDSGVDPDMQDTIGYNAMGWAKYNEDVFIINMLKEFGADAEQSPWREVPWVI